MCNKRYKELLVKNESIYLCFYCTSTTTNVFLRLDSESDCYHPFDTYTTWAKPSKVAASIQRYQTSSDRAKFDNFRNYVAPSVVGKGSENKV